MQKKILPIFILLIIAALFSSLFAQRPSLEEALERQLVVNNNIATKVNGKTISFLDVAKKLNYLFYQTNPENISSDAAKYQFYLSSWRFALVDLINTELMLAEAKSKDVKIPDSEIKEALQERFGPNVTLTLNKLDLTYDEAFQLIKTDEIVKRIRWFFINAKALQKVTPQMIRAEYEKQLSENPSGDFYHFQIVTVKDPNQVKNSALALKTYQLLKDQKNIEAVKQELVAEKVELSAEYNTAAGDLSSFYKSQLSALKEGEYSTPVSQISAGTGQTIWRIFYLKKKEIIEKPSFSKLRDKIKEDLLQQTVREENARYFETLYHKYGVDEMALQKLLSDEHSTPFFLR